jgi:hypothetical protein
MEYITPCSHRVPKVFLWSFYKVSEAFLEFIEAFP